MHDTTIIEIDKKNSQTWLKTTLASVLLMSAGCAMSFSVWAVDTSVKELRIGYQKSSINFAVAKQNKYLEQEFPNAKISWNEFPAGPQILEALAVGSIDVGVTGDTPPVYAQAAGKPLYYVAYEAAKPLASAILIPKNSSIKQLKDLKGKRIALQKGSSSHFLLVQAVQKAGLTWSDVQPIWLTPADARAAFQKGAVDAWAIWDPYYASAQLEDGAKVLTTGKGLSPNYTFYLAAPKFVQSHPKAVTGLIGQINQADKWVQKNPQQTADLIAKNTGLRPEVSRVFVDRRPKPSGASPLNAKVIKEQQLLADRFSQLNIIPKRISIAEAVWNKN